MKKIIYALLVISASSLIAFGQKPAPVKEKEKTKTAEQKTTIQREKFDPTRDAAKDLQAAIGAARKEGKRIILDIGGEWCIWCVLMDNYFIKNPDLAKIRDENFVWLKINMSPENENKAFLAAYPAATGYPHLYVLDTDGKFLYSKNTAELEEGKGYNLQKFTDFLNEYSSSQTTVADKTNLRLPEITIEQALDIAKNYIVQNQINVSDKYIDSIQLNLNSRGDRGKYWRVSFELSKFAKGGQIYLDIFMDKSVELSRGE